MERTRVACYAMATRFEIVISGDSPVHARAAGEEALHEIARIEAQLSWFKPDSVLSRINRHAAAGPFRVPAPVFRLIERCRLLHQLTQGAFDPTVRPGRVGRPPGMDGVRLDPHERTVHFADPETNLNFGGIGKGWAIDAAASILAEAGIAHALIHGGTSTALALGADGGKPWRVAVSHPSPDRSGEIVASIDLQDAALSASGIYGRGSRTDTGWEGHVIDPRDGRPVSHTELAAVVTYFGEFAATDADALSTALLVLGARSTAFADRPTLCHDGSGISESHGPWQTPN